MSVSVSWSVSVSVLVAARPLSVSSEAAGPVTAQVDILADQSGQGRVKYFQSDMLGITITIYVLYVRLYIALLLLVSDFLHLVNFVKELLFNIQDVLSQNL